MINSVRMKLVLRYALVLLSVSSIIFVCGYKVYQKIAREMLQDSLRSYMEEEIYEFKREALLSKIELREIKTDNLSLQFFSFRYSGNYLLQADVPEGKVGRILSEKISVIKDFAKDIQEITFYVDGQKWSFLVLSHEWADILGFQKQVAVAMNITPSVNMMHRYKNYGLTGVLILVAFSLLLAYKMADKAVKPLMLAYDKQKKFASDVSHEMKTPLSVLLTYAEILEKQKSADVITVIKSEVKNMSMLVDNLLTLTRIEQNREQITADIFQPSTVLEKLVEHLNIVHADRLFPIVLTADQNSIAMDPQHLERLATILLDNALKYTPTNKKITVVAKTEDGRFVFQVHDEGIGIPVEEQKHIFERFYRVDKARNRQSGGNGLGLALAKELVALYKGKIEVKSVVGLGSTFTVLLPLK